jgi:trans-aconitate 2-methyltransferase
MPWNHEKYERFREERLAPFHDLVKMIRISPGMRAIDLGCGTGEITAMLADALPQSEVLGIDNSSEMLEAAWPRKRAGLEFRLQPIEEVTGTWDLVFSNAAIQWVDDHPRLIRHLMSLLSPQGQIVIQVPRGHPAMGLIKELAAQEPFAGTLGNMRTFHALPLLTYAELLYQNGGREIVAVERIYPHVLRNADEILAWCEGTALVPYLEKLQGQARQDFLDGYRTMLRQRWPGEPVFFGFQRMLLAAEVG